MKSKIIILIVLINMILPISANALTGSVNLSCKSGKINPGDTLQCTITGESVEEVTNASMKISVSENLTLTEVVTDSSWDGDGDDGNIDLFTDENKKGDFNIATFTVKASSITTGSDTTISLDNIVLSDKDWNEVEFNSKKLSIRIPSTINALSSITINGTKINDFSGDKLSYKTTVDSSKIKVAATSQSSTAKITGDIGEKELKYGTNTFSIKVTSELGATKTYTLTVERPDNRSKDNSLKDFKFLNYDLKFDKDKVDYDLTVDNKISKIALCQGKESKDGTLCIDYDIVNNSLPDKADLEMLFNGKNIEEIMNEFIDVFDSAETKDCTEEKDVCELYYNDVIIGTVKKTGEYMIEYKDIKFEVSINPETQETNYTYLTFSNLNVGKNVLSFTITAENESKKTYTFNINRLDEEGKKVPEKEETGKDVTINKNPNTWSSIGYGIFGLITIIATIIYINVRKNSKFPKRI